MFRGLRHSYYSRWILLLLGLLFMLLLFASLWFVIHTGLSLGHAAPRYLVNCTQLGLKGVVEQTKICIGFGG